MKEYVSKITSTPYTAEQVYAKLSDMENLRPMLSRLNELPENIPVKVNDVQLTTDSVTAVTDKGSFTIRQVEKQPCKLIKLQPDMFGNYASVWIQLLEKLPGTTHIRLTAHIDIPLMLRPLVGNKLDKLKDGLDKAADVLAAIPY